MKSLHQFNLFFLILLFSINIKIVYSDESINIKKNIISQKCKESLDFYLDRPDLETEFLRRLEFCIANAKDVSPEGYITNPVISDFKSRYGVNGRTRVNVHQGVDIIGSANEPIIAIANGKVLETSVTYCEGPTLVIDHGKTLDNKRLITLYSHIGESLVKEGDLVKRGDKIAILPEKIKYPCMARVRHLHIQIGQQYCEKEEKNNWGCGFYIKDLYSSLNPNDYWKNALGKITCFNNKKEYTTGTLTYPFICNKM